MRKVLPRRARRILQMETYTIPEAAEITGQAPRDVRIALETGRLRAVRTGGRWRIPRHELERAGMIGADVAGEGASRADAPPEREQEPPTATAVTSLRAPPAGEEAPVREEPSPPPEEDIGRLHERLAQLERRLDELEGVAEHASREASMREALAPLFSELERPAVDRPPDGPRFRVPR